MDNALECLIRERAYEIWNTTGRPDGRAEQHWLLAEREVRAMLVVESPRSRPQAVSSAVARRQPPPSYSRSRVQWRTSFASSR